MISQFQSVFPRTRALFLVSALFLAPLMDGQAEAMAADKTYQVVPAESQVNWAGKKVTGAHDGSVQVKSGSLVFKKGALSEAKITMDMTTITDKDITDKEYNQKLVNHLKSDDFFSVDKHPEATFASSKVEKKGKGHEYKVSGNMTIKGITHPVDFLAKVTEQKGTAQAEGTIKLDRTKWDVRYGSGKFFENLGDKMINDDFELTFNLKAK